MGALTAASAGTCSSCGRGRLPGAKFCTYCGNSFQAEVKPRGIKRLSGARARSGTDLYFIIVAAILAVLVSHVPVIDSIVYPFKLFGTFVHEWSHALVAIATGGQVERLQINGDFSGETLTAGGWLWLIFSAGYVGAAIAGALLLLAPTRYANRTLIAIGAGSFLMPLIGEISFGTSFTANTWLWTVVFGGVTLLVGLRASPRLAGIFQQFVAVMLCFTAIDSLRNLAWLSVNSPNTRTDAWNGAHYIGMPELAWTIIWFAIAVAAIALSITRVVRRSFA